MIVFLNILTILFAIIGVIILFKAIGDFHLYSQSLRVLENLQKREATAYSITTAKANTESHKEDTIFTVKLGVGFILWPLGLMYVIYYLFRKDGPMSQYYTDFKTLFH